MLDIRWVEVTAIVQPGSKSRPELDEHHLSKRGGASKPVERSSLCLEFSNMRIADLDLNVDGLRANRTSTVDDLPLTIECLFLAEDRR